MKTLRIITFGTGDYLEKYSTDLRNDCAKYNYQFESIAVDRTKNISALNHNILQHMVEYINEREFERLCFMDPECRIIKPLPVKWIDDENPVVFFKVRREDGGPDPKFIYKNRQGNGERLPCRIIGQPMFISKKDVPWISMTLELARAASDPDNGQYTRNEMFIETALNYHGIDYNKENIIYNRNANTKHLAVKGLWATEDTVIQHPDIYGLFDHDIVAGNPVFDEENILDQSLLERHVHDPRCLDELNKKMWMENSDNWLEFENWLVQPSTGKIMLQGLPGVKYHHSIAQKLDKNLNTPAVKSFKFKNSD